MTHSRFQNLGSRLFERVRFETSEDSSGKVTLYASVDGCPDGEGVRVCERNICHERDLDKAKQRLAGKLISVVYGEFP